MKNEIIFKINYLYSLVWIKLHKADKYQYRDNSKVHEFLMSL